MWPYDTIPTHTDYSVIFTERFRFYLENQEFTTQTKNMSRLSFTLLLSPRQQPQCTFAILSIAHWDPWDWLLLRQSWSALRCLAALPLSGWVLVQSPLGYHSPSLKYTTFADKNKQTNKQTGIAVRSIVSHVWLWHPLQFQRKCANVALQNSVTACRAANSATLNCNQSFNVATVRLGWAPASANQLEKRTGFIRRHARWAQTASQQRSSCFVVVMGGLQ